MKIKHQDIHIPSDPDGNPFINCKLDRKKFADILTNIITTYADGFVLAVNNKWGAGKTTFIKMWSQDLKNKGFKTLYYNAWENDFEKDVLIALIAELKELQNGAEESFKKVLNKATPFVSKILPTLAKSLASTYIGDEFVKELIAGIAEVSSKGLEEELKTYNKRKKGLKDFRGALEKFVSEASPDKPVVFFIDELDRCRPNYAVEVLEEIKHLFSVPGIVFVLSIDKEQLGHAVRGVYGSEKINAKEYLRRFIDLEYQIPRPNVQNFINYLYSYFNYEEFLEQPNRKIHQEFSYDVDRFKVMSVRLFSGKEFELRQIEKIFAKIRLVLKGFSFNNFIFPELILLIAYISEKHPSEFDKIQRNQLSLQKFVDGLDIILEPLYDHPNRNQFYNLYGSFLWRYYLDYHKIHNYARLKIYDPSEDNGPLIVKSKFENEDLLLAKAVRNANNAFNTSEIGLSWIFERYNLTSNFQS